MKIFAAIVLLIASTLASAQSVGPGTILMMSVGVTPMVTVGSVYEARPAVILKDGSTCDMTQLLCMRKMERDFGSEMARDLRERGIAAVLKIGN